MLENIIACLKANRPVIAFPEGSDHRILQAAARLHREGILKPLLVGSRQEIETEAARLGLSIEGIAVVDPARFDRGDEMLRRMAELRRGKMDEAACAEALRHGNYFATMLVVMGLADGLLGGATYSTADTVRPALQLVKTRPGSSIVSSCFLLRRPSADGGEELYAMADCAINLDPTAEELAEIAVETARTARVFGIEPRVALLSYSTLGSGKGQSVDKVRQAADKLKAMGLDFPVEGELQFDAAFAPEVAATKAPGSAVAGRANTFLFPDLNAGNIGYKIAQRLGGFEALGPILQGLNAPINDLSRGCVAEEVYQMAIITAAMK